ncbi:MAG: hypothetical protein ACR2LE_00620 [Nocardioidaceae bacterium]
MSLRSQAPVHSQTAGNVRVAGAVALVLGLWGALVPLIGPSFGYRMGSAQAQIWSESTVTLHLVPGVAAVLGALLIMRGRHAIQTLGALLATAGGIWFVIAPSMHPLWSDPGMSGMSGMSGSAMSTALSALGYHYGTGALVTVAAAYALGALAARGSSSDAHVESRPEESVAVRSSLVDSKR